MLSAALKVAHRHKILGTVPGSIFAFSCAKNFLVGQVPFHAERLQIAAKVWNDHIIRLPSVVSLISRVISSNCASVICSIYYAIEIDWALTLTEMRACVWLALIKWNSVFCLRFNDSFLIEDVYLICWRRTRKIYRDRQELSFPIANSYWRCWNASCFFFGGDIQGFECIHANLRREEVKNQVNREPSRPFLEFTGLLVARVVLSDL